MTAKNDNNFLLQYGKFDLEFAIELLEIVRNDHLKRSAPLQNTVLGMPSRSKLLLAAGGQVLDEKICEYGGYENVARRLGLVLFAEDVIILDEPQHESNY